MEARASRAYRDELDALRERAVKADKLESEVGRYREQLHKIEFYKAKAEVRPSLGAFQMNVTGNLRTSNHKSIGFFNAYIYIYICSWFRS